MRFTLKTALLFAFQALLILVPLVWTSSTSELFEYPKILLTYAFTIIIGGLWLARMVKEKQFIFRRTPLELPLLLFLGSQAIATLTSINIHTSLFGYYSRFNGGLVSLLCYALLYFAAVSNFDRTDAKIILKTIVYTALLSALYAFPEHFGHSPSCLIISGRFDARCWVQDVQNRVFGTFGQPNWLAAYLISLIFIPLSEIFENKQTIKRSSYVTRYLPFLLFFLVLIFTKSRSGLLGFIVGLGVFFFAIFTSTKGSKKNVLKIITSCLLLLVTSFLLFGRNVSGTTNKIIDRIIPPPTTVAAPQTPAPANSMEVSITPTSDIRRIVWKGAWQLALKHPFFGTGVETFAYSYYNVRPVEHNLVSEWNFLYNKAHNEFLNYAATTGFVGLGTYLLFLGYFIVWSIKKIVSHKSEVLSPKSNDLTLNTQHSTLLTALLSGFIALCISNFFGFATVPVNTLLFLFPALAYLFTTDDVSNAVPKTQKNLSLSTNGYLLLGVIGAICILLLLAVNRGLIADLSYTAGKAAFGAKNYQVAITKLQDAIRLVPNEPLYTDELAQAASEVAANLAVNQKPAEASEAATIAIQLANRTLNLNKYHLNFYKSRAKIFINLAQINPRFALEAAATLDAAIRLAPTDAKLWLNRALLAKELGYRDEALKTYAKTIELKANDETARFQYGQLLTDMGQGDAAKEQYQYILTRINPNNTLVQAALVELATASARRGKM